MLGSESTDAIISEVLRRDREPPDEDYSVTEFATQVADTLSDGDMRRLITASLRQLPASLASSFLEGLLSRRRVTTLAELLYGGLAVGRQVDTAGVVVELVVGQCGVAPDDVADALLRRINLESEHEVQDRLAFGVWILFNGERLLVADDKVVGFLVSQIDRELDQQLQRHDLSQYAREMLLACRHTSG